MLCLDLHLDRCGGSFSQYARLGGFIPFTERATYFAAFMPYLAVLCFMFPRGKNPLAFGLGMATATGFLYGGLGMLGPATTSLATVWISILLWFSAWLFWAFLISSMMLGLSAREAFGKMRFEAKGTRGLGIAFGLGMFTAVLVLMLSTAATMFLNFHI